MCDVVGNRSTPYSGLVIIPEVFNSISQLTTAVFILFYVCEITVIHTHVIGHPYDRFFEKWQVYLLSEFLSEICWEEIVEKIIFVISNPGFQSNKPAHFLRDYGDFTVIVYLKKVK